MSKPMKWAGNSSSLEDLAETICFWLYRQMARGSKSWWCSEGEYRMFTEDVGAL